MAGDEAGLQQDKKRPKYGRRLKEKYLQSKYLQPKGKRSSKRVRFQKL